MHPLLHRRRSTAWAVAIASLITVLIVAPAPAATATSTDALTAAARESAARAGSDAWFRDPRTPAERRAEIAVPRHPKRSQARLRETRAIYRTRAGDLAVPAGYAFGHTIKKGQAVTLDLRRLFRHRTATLTPAARQQVKRLALALSNASSIRCEGYTDYLGVPRRNHTLAQGRAAAVCSAIAGKNKIARTRVIAYGSAHPAVVARKSKKRALNRRVVVQMTGTRPAAPAPPATPLLTVPGAPTALTVVGEDGTLTTTFGLPETDGGSPTTNFEISYDGGETWEPATTTGDVPWTLIRNGFTNGTTYDVRVRASNDQGHGPAAAAQALVAAVPGAPELALPEIDDQSAVLTFGAPASDGGQPVTAYQFSLDLGETWLSLPYSPTGVPGTFRATLEDLEYGRPYSVQVRAVNVRGHGSASETRTFTAVVPAQPDAPTIRYFGYNSWSVAWEVSFEAGASNGATVTGWEASVNGGPWAPAGEIVEGNVWTARFPCSNGGCGWSYSTPVRLRAVTATGSSLPSQPYAHNIFF